MTASFHALAQKVKGLATSLPFALQIGAMDGVRFDLLHPHLIAGGWRGLLVEPVPDMFEKLRQTYAAQTGITFSNCAIADQNGTLVLRRVDPVAVEKGLIPEEALGITSAFAERALFGHPKFAEAFPEVAQNYVHDITVPCVTLSYLLEQNAVDQIDLVMIDTEGADWLIARQLDVARYHPALICLEDTSLTESEQKDCAAYFALYGYTRVRCMEDEQNVLFYKSL